MNSNDKLKTRSSLTALQKKALRSFPDAQCLSDIQLKVVVVHAIKTYEGVEVQLHSFLTLVLEGSEWPALRPGRLTSHVRTLGIHCTRVLVVLTAGQGLWRGYSFCLELNHDSSDIQAVAYSLH